MKLVSVIKLDKRNVKKIEDDIMSANGEILVIFAIYGQFRAIRKSNSRRMVHNSYNFISIKLLSYKN